MHKVSISDVITQCVISYFADKFQCHYEYSSKAVIKLNRTMKLAKTALVNKYSVVLYGKPGEGKTTSAFRIIKSLNDDGYIRLDKCAILFGPDDLNEIKSADVDLLFIDDMFGKHNSEPGKFSGWSSFFSTLQAFVANRTVRIIISSRMHIFLEFKNKLSGLDLFSRVVELNSIDLLVDEKTDILLAQLKVHNREASIISVADCVCNYDSLIGFPLCAHYFAAEESLYSKKEEYFTKPYKHLLDQIIRNLDGRSLIALLYVLYKENNLKTTDLDITKMDKTSEIMLLHIAKLCGVEFPAATIIRETKQKINNFKNSYIKYINKSYSFLHDTMYEALALFHGEEYPSEIVKYCTVDFLCQCVRLDDDAKEGVLYIEEDDFPALAERCIEEVITCKNGRRLANHPMFKNEAFVEELIRLVTERDETFQNFLNTGLSFMHVGNHGLLFYSVACQCDKDILFKQVVPLLKCGHARVLFDSCWKCSVKSETLAGTCSANRPDLYVDLKRAGAEVRTVCLYKAVENKNIDPELVKMIINDLKIANKFIADDQVLQYCLGMAVQHENRNVFNILKDAGLDPANFDFLYYAVKVGDEDLLSLILNELIGKGKWISDYMTVSRALTEAIVTGKDNMKEILVSTGANLTEFAVYWAIVDHGYESVSQIIDMLKANDAFDVESYDLAHAMAIAMKQMKNDGRIYQFLKDAGVIPTATLVGAVSELGLPIPDIKEIINTLKEKGRWSGDAEERHRATAYMAACRRTDTVLADFLLSEGAGMSPGCLRYAVVRHVEKVDYVIKSLKSSGELNPDNKEIARAFVWSIEYKDKTMYNKLVEAGLVLSIACLVPAVEYFYCSATLEHVISGLKETKRWDPEHDLASEALNLANKRQDKSAYNRLISEGVTWKPRNLYVAVQFETVYGLKQVIKQLKDRNLLHFSNEEIRNAVSQAMVMKDKRKYSLLKDFGLA